MTTAVPAARKRGRRTITKQARAHIINLHQAGKGNDAVTRAMNETRFKPARGKHWHIMTIKRVLQQAGVYSPQATPGIPTEILERIFALRAEGHSPYKIARIFTDEGIPTARGGQWRSTTIQYVLERHGRYVGVPALTIEEQLRKHTSISRLGEHRIWTSAKNGAGYPVVRRDGKQVSPARLAFEAANGPLDGNAEIVNVCGRRDCVNPDHWRVRGTWREEFWLKVTNDPETSCELWTGAIDSNGYGQVSVPGKGTQLAHRVAYELRHGAIPEGQELHHQCPRRACVKHLIPVEGRSDHADAHRQERAINAGAASGKLWEEATALPRASDDEIHVRRIGTAAPPPLEGRNLWPDVLAFGEAENLDPDEMEELRAIIEAETLRQDALDLRDQNVPDDEIAAMLNVPEAVIEDLLPNADAASAVAV